MLSAKELLDYKKKSATANVVSLGSKLTEPVAGPNYQLDQKLENIEELLAMERVKMVGQLSKAIWRDELKKAEVTKKTGPYWDVFGHSTGGKLYLHAEEALFLIDVGALDLTYNDVTLSLQRAYFLLLHNTGTSLSHYRVFQHLSLLGYKVMRHTKKNVLTKYEKDLEIHKVGIKHSQIEPTRRKPLDLKKDPKRSNFSSTQTLDPISSDIDRDVLERLQGIGPVMSESCDLEKDDAGVRNKHNQIESAKRRRLDSETKESPKTTNLNSTEASGFPISYGLDSTTADILERLQTIGPQPEICELGKNDVHVDFDVFLPKDGSLQKSSVQLPDLRVCAFSGEDTAPDLQKLGQVQNFFEDEVPILTAVVFTDSIQLFQIGQIVIPQIE